ncbi:MAG: hypothetical protein ACK5RL_09185 [Acidimicrobiales bacterium]
MDRKLLDATSADWDNPADVDRPVSEPVDDALELIAATEYLDFTDVQAETLGLLGLIIGQDVEPDTGLITAQNLTPGSIDDAEAATDEFQDISHRCAAVNLSPMIWSRD